MKIRIALGQTDSGYDVIAAMEDGGDPHQYDRAVDWASDDYEVRHFEVEVSDEKISALFDQDE